MKLSLLPKCLAYLLLTVSTTFLFFCLFIFLLKNPVMIVVLVMLLAPIPLMMLSDYLESKEGADE